MDFLDLPESDDGVVVETTTPPVVPPPVPEVEEPVDVVAPSVPIDSVAAFNKKWQASIDAKAAKEVESEKAVRLKASEELSNWKTQREIRLNAKKDANRIEEQDLLEGLESEVDGINTWDRVMKLVTTNTEIEAGCTDTSRMRNLFIQLKNDPLEKTQKKSSE